MSEHPLRIPRPDELTDQQRQQIVNRAIEEALKYPPDRESEVELYLFHPVVVATGLRLETLTQAYERAKKERDAHQANGAAVAQRLPWQVYPTPGADAADPTNAVFSWKTTPDLVTQAQPPSWLVRYLLVNGQPAIIGGGKKCLKTTLVVDLALSLNTASRFLFHFECPRSLPVGVISGESGDWVLAETIRRVCRAKGIDPRSASAENGCFWGFQLPRLTDAGDLARLKNTIRQTGIKVLVLDPLYTCLLAGPGGQNISASNVYQMGPLLYAVAEVCREEGCTLILVHHTRLHPTNPYGTPELEDLAYAGIQEFAAQWLLVGRRQAFEPGTGSHQIWLHAGGRCGQGGLWPVNVEESRLKDDFSGRTWEVTVLDCGQERQNQESASAAAKAESRRRKDSDECARLLEALDRLTTSGQDATYTQVRSHARLDSEGMTRATDTLAAQGVLEVVEIEVRSGRGGKTLNKAKGLRRIRPEDLSSPETRPLFGV